MESLVKGIIPLVTEKNEFEYRNKSILMNSFQKLLTIGFIMKQSKMLVLQPNEPL